MARLAGYVCIAGMPDELPMPLRLPSVAPSSGGEGAVETTIDRDEPILSDVHNLAVET